MKACPTCQHTYPDDFSLCPRDGAPLTAQATETEAQLAAGLSRRFRIVRQLGKGGMGTVFLAEQIGVGNRPVALKVLNRKLLDDPDFLLRFQNEAGSTGRIHHPNVVTIYESSQGDDGTPYIAMEFLEGESLREALSRRGAFPVTEVAEILQQAARGLSAAHKLGIIHRDLKPDNIFLTRDAEYKLKVKIVDFGIAKLRESVMHTQTGMVLGTPAYMSFEQASGMKSDELDARSDIYSLGVVVFEMLTGRTPFHSDTPVGYLRKHLMEEPPPFGSIAQDLHLPPQVEAVVMNALKKEREERYRSVLEFAHAFVAAVLPAAAPQVNQPLPSTMVVVSPAVLEADMPVPRPSTTPAQADVTVQTPPPAWPARNAEGPMAQRQRSKPLAAASRLPTGGRPPQFKMISEPPGKMKFVVIGVVAIILIAAGVWYFSQQGSKNQSPDGSVKKGEVSSPAKAGPSQGEVRLNPKDGLNYVWVPPGTFMMGCSPEDKCGDEEKPPHHVTLTKGFWMGQTEVTVGAYKRFTGATGRQMPPEPVEGWYSFGQFRKRPLNPGWGDQAMPIVNVTSFDAQAYCSWAGGRLPTEAEWEYAARAGSTASRYGDLDEIAWYADNSGRQHLDSTKLFGTFSYPERTNENGDNMHDVGQKRANGFGLYDMLGNVEEWVNDWSGANYYKDSPSQDPTGPTTRGFRIVRGGSWVLTSREARASGRLYMLAPDERNTAWGFRCGGGVFAP